MKYMNETIQVPVEVYPWFHNSFQLRAGVVLIAEVGLVSFVSVAGLLTVVALRALKRWNRIRDSRVLEEDEPLQPVALLFILAMCMELLQAFTNIMSVRWGWQGATTEGRYCTVQAVLKQVGNDGAALFTMFLAIMTVLPTIRQTALSDGKGRKVVLGMMTFVVVFWLLLITVPAITIDNYYGSTGPWCWIPTKKDGKAIKRNEIMGILTEYGWFWLSSLTCFICYGHIVVRWWREADGNSELIRQAVVMVWYPIAYFVEIFPQSVVCLLQMHDALVGKPSPPNGWTVLTTVMFASSGWVNVLLWVITGRQFGFTAASTRAASDNETNPGGAVFAPKGRYGYTPAVGYEFENRHPPAFSPSHTSAPSYNTLIP